MALFRYKDSKTQALADHLNETAQRQFTQEELFQFAPYDPDAGERGGYSGYSYWRSTLRAFRKDRTAMFFLCVIALTLLFTFLEPLIPYDRQPNTIYYTERAEINLFTRQPVLDENGDPVVKVSLAKDLAPGKEFWFGTNTIGQDLWSQIWAGTRNSLAIGFAVACVDALLGILVGVLWGYVRKLDFLFTELYNVFDNVPQTLLVIIISYILRPGMSTMIFAMCLTSWLQTARFVRNQVVIIRDRDYNLASRCLGTSTWHIITRNLLPYLVSIITMRMALAIPAAINNEVFITYIGLGVPLETPTLGNLVEAGRKVMSEAALRYQLFIPVIILATITISFYIIGNAFADAADPKNHVN
ncbi:MAG: ABC transporter permease [Pseudoflavonifractor sp.]|nr:ABC transporter permease [Pseudoflavonifractor sp.]MDY3019841.1 ABC transporter permease [Oscillospiraceae bacterium]